MTTEQHYIKTNYEDTVSAQVRRHVEELMQGWRAEGRSDEVIEHIVRSAVLMAWGQGRIAGLREVAAFTVERLPQTPQVNLLQKAADA